MLEESKVFFALGITEGFGLVAFLPQSSKAIFWSKRFKSIKLLFTERIGTFRLLKGSAKGTFDSNATGFTTN